MENTSTAHTRIHVHRADTSTTTMFIYYFSQTKIEYKYFINRIVCPPALSRHMNSFESPTNIAKASNCRANDKQSRHGEATRNNRSLPFHSVGTFGATNLSASNRWAIKTAFCRFLHADLINEMRGTKTALLFHRRKWFISIAATFAAKCVTARRRWAWAFYWFSFK